MFAFHLSVVVGIARESVFVCGFGCLYIQTQLYCTACNRRFGE